MVAKVLLGWELGEGLGHIQRLLILGKELQQQGFEPHFVLKNIPATFTYPAQLTPVPVFSPLARVSNYSDLLAQQGFEHLSTLQPLIWEWWDILKQLKPQFVLADHAPGLVVAAWGRVPVFVVGTGFTVPPPVTPLPAFMGDLPAVSYVRAEVIQQTLYAITGQNQPIGEWLQGDGTLLFTIPELDPYHSYRPKAHYLGLPQPPSGMVTRGTGSFHYLAMEYPDRPRVQAALPGSEYLRGTKMPLRPLADGIQDKAVIVHHGGLTTSLYSLLAGIGQIILPRHPEQRLTGQALARLGVAQVLDAPRTEDLTSAYYDLYQRPQVVQQAQRLVPWRVPSWRQVLAQKIEKIFAVR